MKILYIFSLILLFTVSNNAQVSISSDGSEPDISAMLDIKSTDKGILIPRLTEADRFVFMTPAVGLLVYQTDGESGFYYFNGDNWFRLSTAINNGGNSWNLNGNSSTNAFNDFVGTTDSADLSFRVFDSEKLKLSVNGTLGFYNTGESIFVGDQSGAKDDHSNNRNIFIGHQAAINNTTGSRNIVIGRHSLHNNTIRSDNIAIGDSSLFNNGDGAWLEKHSRNNIAIGFKTLYNSTTPHDNIAIGYKAMEENLSGPLNVAVGSYSLNSNGDGSANTAIGYKAMTNNTIGVSNSAVGCRAMFLNHGGNRNTGFGYEALYNNFNGYHNTALGHLSLHDNSSGLSNVAVGSQALEKNSTGSFNSACGKYALHYNLTGSQNTGMGNSALSSNRGDDNVAIGYRSGDPEDFNIVTHYNQSTFVGSETRLDDNRTNITMLGYGITSGQCTGNNQIMLGNTAITEIRAQVPGLTVYSDRRFKKNIKDDIVGLDFLLKLKPLSYTQDPTILHNIWGTNDSLVNKIDFNEIKDRRFMGFMAQDVEKAASEINYNFPGINIPKTDKEAYSLRYIDFIPILVKGLQEQQVIINDYTAEINKFKQENQEKNIELEKLNKRIIKLESLIIKSHEK